MDYYKLLKILITWSADKGEFELLYYLYNFFDLGIPNKLLYKFPSSGVFNLSHVHSKTDIINRDFFLNKLLRDFKTSKYKKLKHWDNSYGFI